MIFLTTSTPGNLYPSALAFDDQGTLFGLALRGNQPDERITIDLTTGEIVPVGLTGTSEKSGGGSLAFDYATHTMYVGIRHVVHREP
jgi:hypothetical protein